MMFRTGDILAEKPSIGKSSDEVKAMSVSSALSNSMVSPPRHSAPRTAPVYAFLVSFAFKEQLPAIVINPKLLYAMNTSADTGQFGDILPGL